MQSGKWKVGNQGVVAVLMVVGVVTVGAIGWLFIDKRLSSSSWQSEKVILEKSLMLAQAERQNLEKQLEELKKQVQNRLEGIQTSALKFEAENRLLAEEKSTLAKEIALLKEKLNSSDGGSYFSDMLKEKAELEVAVGELRSSIAGKEAELSQLKEKNAQILAKLSEGGKSEAAFQKQLAEKDKVNSLLSRYLADEKRQVKNLKTQLVALAEEKRKIALQLDEIVSERELAQQKLAEVSTTLAENAREKEQLKAKLESVYEVVNDRLTEMVKVKKALETSLDDTRAIVQQDVEEIELEPIVVRGAGAAKETNLAAAKIPSLGQELAPVPSQERPASVAKVSESSAARELVGRVLVVNEKLNFIVVNLGANQGVQIGMKMNVVNENDVIANTQVIEVRDNIAAADIQNLKMNGQIKEGDFVRFAAES